MPPLPGFSDNPLQTREDIKRAAEALIRPLQQYFSPGCARIRIPVASGTHFDETAAQLEGFARPLWVIAPLLMSSEEPDWDVVQPWIDGFETGTDPNHSEYWGPIRDHDQKMVECEMISFALLAVPKPRLWNRLSSKTQSNVTNWLLGIHGKSMPPANWLWFRVFANLALLKTCGVDNAAVRESLDADLRALDTFYVGDGWSGDGLWRSEEVDEQEWSLYQSTGRVHAIPKGRNMCYYSGSFAIQFSQLLYVRFAGDLDQQRTQRYLQQARDYGAKFWRYFDADGAAVPFGRSLTYRFACGGFFAALAVAGIQQMPKPLNTAGSIKGFLLRHLRWWAQHSDNIFHVDGTLNLGWTYPNMYLTEDYNSPQSVYWALKSFIVVSVAEKDTFWTEPEAPYPCIGVHDASILAPSPQQILCNHPDGSHHFMLSFSQFIGLPFKGGLAKYCKFAYSSSFGFSVPNGPNSLGQLAPDSALVFSRDGGETWAVKYKSSNARYGKLSVFGTDHLIGSVSWYPWADHSVLVRTTMIPPTSRWPDWHVRIHRIKAGNSTSRLFLAEGGFSINGRQHSNHQELPELAPESLRAPTYVGTAEGVIKTNRSVLIVSDKGASGISTETLSVTVGKTSAVAFKPEPNTNIMEPRTLIPLLEHDIVHGLVEGQDIVIIAKVFAISVRGNCGISKEKLDLTRRWLDEPSIKLGDGDSKTQDQLYVPLHLVT